MKQVISIQIINMFFLVSVSFKRLHYYSIFWLILLAIYRSDYLLCYVTFSYLDLSLYKNCFTPRSSSVSLNVLLKEQCNSNYENVSSLTNRTTNNKNLTLEIISEICLFLLLQPPYNSMLGQPIITVVDLYKTL